MGTNQDLKSTIYIISKRKRIRSEKAFDGNRNSSRSCSHRRRSPESPVLSAVIAKKTVFNKVGVTLPRSPTIFLVRRFDPFSEKQIPVIQSAPESGKIGCLTMPASKGTGSLPILNCVSDDGNSDSKLIKKRGGCFKMAGGKKQKKVTFSDKVMVYEFGADDAENG